MHKMVMIHHYLVIDSKLNSTVLIGQLSYEATKKS